VSDRPLTTRTLDWLRAHHRVDPSTPVKHEGSVALVIGSVEESPTSTLAFDVCGLVALGSSAALSVMAQHSSVAGLGRTMMQTGIVGTLVAGLALLAFAWLVRSANRVPVAVRVHGSAREPIAAHSIEDLRRRAPNREAWVVAESGFSTDALTAATRLGVRCFHAQGPEIAEVARDMHRGRLRGNDER
jgi:hypothetical protein